MPAHTKAIDDAGLRHKVVPPSIKKICARDVCLKKGNKTGCRL